MHEHILDGGMGPLASTERSLVDTGSFHSTGYQSNEYHSRTSHWVELLASTERSLMDTGSVRCMYENALEIIVRQIGMNDCMYENALQCVFCHSLQWFALSKT